MALGRNRSAPSHSAAALTDPATFRSFYAEASQRVYSYLFHRCGGVQSLTEDLTQATFLDAVRAIREGQVITSPQAWVLGIARHKLVDHWRKEEREQRLLEVAWDVESRLVTWERENAREDALEALRSIPPGQRAALVLRYMDELPVAEAAKALGKSIAATESLISRGRESFKRHYMRERHG